MRLITFLFRLPITIICFTSISFRNHRAFLHISHCHYSFHYHSYICSNNHVSIPCIILCIIWKGLPIICSNGSETISWTPNCLWLIELIPELLTTVEVLFVVFVFEFLTSCYFQLLICIWLLIIIWVYIFLYKIFIEIHLYIIFIFYKNVFIKNL